MNSTENDVILSGIDSFIPLGKPQMTILDRVDRAVELAIEANDPDVAFQDMKGLLDVSQISGLAFAKFVYTMTYQWKSFGRRGTVIEAMEDKLGRGKKSINDNYRVWEMLITDDIPKEYRDKFKTMPVRILIPIANLWKQEWEVEPHQWMKLANAPDPTTVRKIIQEIKGVEPKKDSLNIEWNRDSKCITGWKNGEPHPLYLQYDDNDPVISAMLERLFGGGKALER